jgi:hypothetical protein
LTAQGLSPCQTLSLIGCSLYAFDLIEHDGEDMRNRPFLDRKAELARLLRNTGAGILFNEHIAEDGPVVFAHACRRPSPTDPTEATNGVTPCPTLIWLHSYSVAPSHGVIDCPVRLSPFRIHRLLL